MKDGRKINENVGKHLEFPPELARQGKGSHSPPTQAGFSIAKKLTTLVVFALPLGLILVKYNAILTTLSITASIFILITALKIGKHLLSRKPDKIYIPDKRVLYDTETSYTETVFIGKCLIASDSKSLIIKDLFKPEQLGTSKSVTWKIPYKLCYTDLVIHTHPLHDIFILTLPSVEDLRQLKKMPNMTGIISSGKYHDRGEIYAEFLAYQLNWIGSIPLIGIYMKKWAWKEIPCERTFKDSTKSIVDDFTDFMKRWK